MSKTLAFILCISFASLVFGQDRAKYSALVQEAWSLYQSRDYQRSAGKYREAFTVFGGKAYSNDRYNAACSYALAGNSDSAFYHLFRLATAAKYDNYGHITSDPDLKSLYPDPRWPELLTIVQTNKEEAEKHLNRELAAILDTIYQDDQKYRMEIDQIEAEFGRDSEEMKAHWDLIEEKDSINLIKVQALIDEYGWLGPKTIGKRGSQTLFLVIQHSPLEVQEKYLPVMRAAVKEGRASAGNLALLEDRVALRQGKRQIYGSQIGRDPDTGAYYVLPLEDPAQVDQRRAEVGLEPLQDYVSNWGITWNAAENEQKLPEIENRHKQNK